MRLIDADALIEIIGDHVTTVSVCPTVEWARGKTQMKQIVLEDIENAPTIEAEPVKKVNGLGLQLMTGYLARIGVLYVSGNHRYFGPHTVLIAGRRWRKVYEFNSSDSTSRNNRDAYRITRRIYHRERTVKAIW